MTLEKKFKDLCREACKKAITEDLDKIEVPGYDGIILVKASSKEGEDFLKEPGAVGESLEVERVTFLVCHP